MRNLLRKSELARNSSILIGGTLLAQIIPVLLQFVLRRMYSPEEFGMAAVYFTIVSILAVGGSLSYHSAIVLPKEDKDGNSLVVGSLVISVFFSILVFLIILLFSNPIIEVFKLPLGIKDWMYLIPVSVLFNSGHLIFSNWLIRKKAFKALAYNKISRRSSEGAAQVSLNALWKGNGVLLGTIIGDFINYLTYLFQFRRSGGRLVGVSKDDIKANLKKYLHFPKISLIPNLMSTVSLLLPVLIINAFYKEEITGQFDLSRQILALPLALISMSLSQVLLQKISQSRNDKTSVIKTIKRIFWLLFLGAGAASIVTFFFGEEIITLVFGDKWRLAGDVTELLIFGYAIKFIVSPFSSTFIAFEQLKLNSLWQILYSLGIIAMLMFDDLSFENFILLYVGIDLFFYFWYGVIIYYIINKYEKSLKLETPS